VYRIDLATGHRKLLVRPQNDVWDWYADSSGVVRAGFGYRQVDWFMVYREADGQRFRRLPGHKYDDDVTALDLYQFASGSDQGYVLSNEKTGRYALYRYDYANEKLGELVFENATNDISDAVLSEDNKRVIYVGYTDDRDRIVWLDPMIKLYQELLETQWKGKDVEIVSMNRKRDRFIVWAGEPEYPGTYYFFDASSNRLRALSHVNEQLDEAHLARTTYTRYAARDGVEIPAYLTLPKGRVAKNLPLVILPHGGPYGVRDSLGYDSEVQFLANRGYAVLQPNYRGSTGYGEKFEELGDGQWGRAMQNDLDDGMDWLVKQGIVDAKRVCLYGSSYGGYAALWGATRNPERYRCAASFAGVSDLRRNLKYQEGSMRRGDRGDWHAQVQGDDKFHLESVSPLQQVASLKVPVLLGHGADDKVVLPKQSSLYEAALKRSGKTYEYYTYPREGHGFAEPGHYQDWLERLDAFLTKYNPAD
jgi:dienelactone hydrolase